LQRRWQGSRNGANRALRGVALDQFNSWRVGNAGHWLGSQALKDFRKDQNNRFCSSNLTKTASIKITIKNPGQIAHVEVLYAATEATA
jgi:hypothetical protein